MIIDSSHTVPANAAGAVAAVTVSRMMQKQRQGQGYWVRHGCRLRQGRLRLMMSIRLHDATLSLMEISAITEDFANELNRK